MLNAVIERWKKSKPLTNKKEVSGIRKQYNDKFCFHDWQHVQDRQVPRSTYMNTKTSIEYEDGVLAYCPKCRRTEKFFLEDWEAIKKIQELDKKYHK